jgi:hypothetical protein
LADVFLEVYDLRIVPVPVRREHLEFNILKTWGATLFKIIILVNFFPDLLGLHFKNSYVQVILAVVVNYFPDLFWDYYYFCVVFVLF